MKFEEHLSIHKCKVVVFRPNILPVLMNNKCLHFILKKKLEHKQLNGAIYFIEYYSRKFF